MPIPIPLPTPQDLQAITNYIAQIRQITIPDPPGPPVQPTMDQAMHIAEMLQRRMLAQWLNVMFDEIKPKF